MHIELNLLSQKGCIRFKLNSMNMSSCLMQQSKYLKQDILIKVLHFYFIKLLDLASQIWDTNHEHQAEGVPKRTSNLLQATQISLKEF
jgi:hypothetical protein